MATNGQNTLKGALDKLDRGGALDKLERGSGLAKIEHQESHMRKVMSNDPGFAKLSPKAQEDQVRAACADWKAMTKHAGGKSR